MLGDSVPGSERETLAQRALFGRLKVLGWDGDGAHRHERMDLLVPQATGILDIGVDLRVREIARRPDLNLELKHDLLSIARRQAFVQRRSQIVIG